MYVCICVCVSQCSVTCGIGVQSREVYCRMKGTGRVSAELCDARLRPAASQPCLSPDCHHYLWAAEEWHHVSILKASSPRLSLEIFLPDRHQTVLA